MKTYKKGYDLEKLRNSETQSKYQKNIENKIGRLDIREFENKDNEWNT